jgi:hypothetical protein
MRSLPTTVILALGLHACSRGSALPVPIADPAPPSASPLPAEPAPSIVEPFGPLTPVATSNADIECDNGHDPHPAPTDAGGIGLSRFGTVGGGPCWFADVHGEVAGDVTPAAQALGRAACATFGKLRACYEAARGPQKKDHFGHLDVVVTVGAGGAVDHLSASGDTLGDTGLTKCALADLRGLRLGAEASPGRYGYGLTFTQRPSLGVCAGR